jgi:hypothetical protein
MGNREPDMIDEVFLRGFPNPERAGCLPESERSGMLRALARKELPIHHPHRKHLGRCSPCFQEFVPLRDAYKTERVRARNRSIASVVLLLVASSVGVYVLVHKPTGLAPAQGPQNVAAARPTVKWTAVRLDYEDASPTRGAEPQRIVKEQSAPRKLAALKIFLPLGSDDGEYQIEVRRGSAEASALKAWTGVARIEDGHTILDVNTDLSGFAPGHYVLAIRHADASWRSVPLLIE